ncbi:MAG: acyltransferase [Cyanobacteria bacterium K_DeepCast_35m_m1_288]|nr:acyltransferase [Cyanobacteria bacterium K_DeepCast_35m_m1_288]
MNRSSGSSSFYEGIDFMRAAAVFLVLWSHAGPLLPQQWHVFLYSSYFRPGFWGVTLFFAISGFLILGQLFDMAQGRRDESLRVFVLRRCLRTMPTYWLATGLVLLLGIVAWPGSGVLAANLMFVQNLAGFESVLPVSWSLVIEVWSYMLFALLAWGSCALANQVEWISRSIPIFRSRESLLLLSLVLLPVFASLIRFDLAVEGASIQQIKQSLAPQWDALAYGGILAWLQRFRPSLFRRTARLPWLAPVCLLLMASATASVPFLFASVQLPVPRAAAGWLSFGFYPCVGLLAALFLLSVWNFCYAWLPCGFDRLCRWLSRCSYSVYLLHLAVASLLAPLGPSFLAFVLYLLLSILVGAVGWRVMERPFTRLRYKL